MVAPTPASFRDELTTVVARHNELVRAEAALVATTLVNVGDEIVDRHGLAVDVDQDAESRWSVLVDGDSIAFLGYPRDADTGLPPRSELPADAEYELDGADDVSRVRREP